MGEQGGGEKGWRGGSGGGKGGGRGSAANAAVERSWLAGKGKTVDARAEPRQPTTTEKGSADMLSFPLSHTHKHTHIHLPSQSHFPNHWTPEGVALAPLHPLTPTHPPRKPDGTATATAEGNMEWGGEGGVRGDGRGEEGEAWGGGAFGQGTVKGKGGRWGEDRSERWFVFFCFQLPL